MSWVRLKHASRMQSIEISSRPSINEPEVEGIAKSRVQGKSAVSPLPRFEPAMESTPLHERPRTGFGYKPKIPSDPRPGRQSQPHEPAVQEDVVHLVHHVPFGATNEQDLDQAGPDRPFRRDRGTPEVTVDRSQLGIATVRGLVYPLPTIAPRVLCRETLLQINAPEQDHACLLRTAHQQPPHLSRPG